MGISAIPFGLQGGAPDRRQCARFTVSGAVVSCSVRGFWHRSHTGAGEKWPVVDVSTSGLSFLTNEPVGLDRNVSLVLVFAEQEPPVTLEGRVVYQLPRGARLSFRYRVGVQFEHFGARREKNAASSLEVLNKLEQRHALLPK
jgi:hypothetical protein